MDNTKQYRDQQEAKQLQNRISSFMKDFKVGTLLHGNGIRKLRGVSPLTLFTVIFSLPFKGVNFSRGIVSNPNLGFKKDAAYDYVKWHMLESWRPLLFTDEDLEAKESRNPVAAAQRSISAIDKVRSKKLADGLW